MEDTHVAQGETMPTLMAARVRVPLVSGAAVGGARLMTAREAARLMGVRLRSDAWLEAERRFGESALWEVACDAVDAHHTRALWRNAEEMLESTGRSLRGRVLLYVGSHVGALDTILMGGRTLGLAIECCALAERDKGRRASAGTAYLVPEARRFVSALAMARGFRVMVDVVTMTPSCKLLSSAQRGLTAAQREALKRRAFAQLRADVLALELLVEGCRPTVIMIEESSGLLSHHKEAFAWMQHRCLGWPYRWRFACNDCATLGAAHRRKRVLWVAVREVRT